MNNLCYSCCKCQSWCEFCFRKYESLTINRLITFVNTYAALCEALRVIHRIADLKKRDTNQV